MNDMNPIDHAIQTLETIQTKVDKLIEAYHAKANQKEERDPNPPGTKEEQPVR